MSRYKDRIEQLENEVKEKQEEIELTNNQSTIDILEEDLSVETIKNIMPKKYHELIDETEDLVVKRIYE